MRYNQVDTCLANRLEMHQSKRRKTIKYILHLEYIRSNEKKNVYKTQMRLKDYFPKKEYLVFLRFCEKDTCTRNHISFVNA